MPETSATSSNQIECIFFDADEIRAALERDLASGLRMLADAVESNALKGRLISAEGVAGGRWDPDINVLVKLIFGAPSLSLRRIQKAKELEAVHG